MKIRLELVKKKDVNSKWVYWLNNKQINKYSSKKFKKFNIEGQKKFIKDKYIYKILVKNNLFVGVCEIIKKNHVKRIFEISYFIGDNRYLNKGIGTNLIDMLKKKIKKNFKGLEVFAGTNKLNIKSQKILLKNNFVKCKTSKENFFFKCQIK